MSKRTKSADNNNNDKDHEDGGSSHSDSNNGETKAERKIRRSLKKIKKQKKQVKRESKRHKSNRSKDASSSSSSNVVQQQSTGGTTAQLHSPKQQQITSLPLSQPLPALSASSLVSQSQHLNEAAIVSINPQQLDSNSKVTVPVNDKDSNPFERKKARLLVSLLPASLRNINKAINGAMQSLLLRYSDGIGGVLLSFDNIQIEDENQPHNNHDDTLLTTTTTQQRKGHCITTGGGRYGRILDEMPHIHYYITSNILVFSPTLQQQITGVVNESFPSHVGILAYDFFNAMVSAESLRAGGFTFDSDLNEWSRVDTGVVVQIEDSMVFTVDKIHECSGLISIEGSHPSIVGATSGSG